MSTHSLESIAAALAEGRQRATYGAVAGLLDRPPAYLMQGAPRTPMFSWIVNAETLLPTGYTEEQMAAELTASTEVIRTAAALEQWLSERTR